ncbi:TonB-dependent receptor [Sphingomonas canadensis]|uniref:TonB-dependent receptor n=1 Tax=Sphingomonas canadensis TaxID=1219257 RepID=A0ABW3H8B9_9SPHN|nr:TonB-dependent receptor [Sphingomonas canadensis]MCW3837498.1 TonB-dependent receptor [Sphingomonas canadensis]
MRNWVACLLAGTSMLAAGAAHAAPGDAAPATEAEAPAAADEGTEIVVIGQGESRQVQRLGADDIAELAPGTSPLKAVEKLPSVNFQGADPFGAYEWAERISIRGFNQNQLGFTLDGIPLGDASYGNVNGLHISRAITSENVGEVRVSQGAGSIGTQATNNLGGTLEFFSRDPSQDFGVNVEGTYGTENTVRLFGRIDTGALVENGPRLWVSGLYSNMDKWKGVGEQRTTQVNAKGVVPAGPVNITGTLSFSDRRENDYQDLSLGMLNRLGYDWDNISGDYALAVRLADIANNIDGFNNTTGLPGADGLSDITGLAPTNPGAGTVFPSPIASLDDAYYDAAGLRRDWLASLGVESNGGPVRFALKGYYHDNHGQGLWYTPYVATPGGAPLTVRTTEYDIERTGVFGSVGGTFGFNEVTVGAWYENNDFLQARRFYGLSSRTASTRDSLEFQSNPLATQWEFQYNTKTFQYHVEDKLSFGDLTLTLGWKGFDVRNTADPVVAGSLASGKIKVTDWFQPHAGFAWKFMPEAELFGGFTQVTRAFTSAATTGPFATTQAGFNALGALKPEQSDTYELGARFRNGSFNGLVAAYYVDFRNRLLAQTTGAGIVGNPAILQNVGSVRSLGFEAAGEVRLGQGFSAYLSYSYNDSTYRDDVRNPVGTLIAATKGKTVVDAPKSLVKGEIAYDGEIFFGKLSGNYISRRYFTYENDQSVDGRVLFDLSVGARVSVAGANLELQGSVTNLFDEEYVSTMGTNGFGNRGDNQTLMVGAPRQFLLTLKTGF